MVQKEGAKLFNVNAPDDAPPSLPRLVLLTKDGMNLNICLDRYDLTLTPPDHVADSLDEVLDYLRSIFERFVGILINDIVAYRWMGIVLSIEYPESSKSSKTAIEAVTPTFHKLTNIRLEDRPLRSFRLMYGYEEYGFFFTIAVEGFEQRDILIPVPTGEAEPKDIDVADHPISSLGVQIVHDVNNKPGPKQNPLEDFAKILDCHRTNVKHLPEKLGINSVISR